MRRRTPIWLALGGLTVALLAAGIVTAAADVSSGSAARDSATLRCPRGTVRAKLSSGVKCLRVGQRCRPGKREYLRYGFYCRADGRLARRQARPKPKQQPRVSVTSIAKQPIDGWGSGLVGDFEWAIDPAQTPPSLQPSLYDALYRELGLNYVRVFLGGFGSAAVAPPADCTGAVGPGSQFRANFVRTLRANYPGVKVIFTGADALPAMKGSGHQSQTLVAGQEAAYGNYLVDWAKCYAQNGARGDYIASGNEEDNPQFFNMSAAQQAAVYAQIASRIAGEGLSLRLMLADTENYQNCRTFAAAALTAPKVRDYTAAIGCHRYKNFGTSTDADRQRVRALADTYGARVWMTEWSEDAGAPPGDCGAPGPPVDTITEALAWSTVIADELDGPAQISAFHHLRSVAREHGAANSLLLLQPQACGAPATSFLKTKRFYVFENYVRAAPPGSTRLAVTNAVPTAGVHAVAFKLGGSRRLVLANATARPVTLTVDLGTPRTTLRGWRTSATENYAPVVDATYDGPRNFTLPAASVTTLVLR